ncbi:hypothetical protein ASE91_14180 [Sphingomonas sp. Leaf62]|nr:hypothetical protein ASE91_14180 [Sphingomonas sp. Leaf62]
MDFVRFLFLMGNKSFRTTFDLIRFGANLRVLCRCGNQAILDGEQVDHVRRTRKWPMPLGYFVDRLTCSKCGRRPSSALPYPGDPTVRIGPSMLEDAAALRSIEHSRNSAKPPQGLGLANDDD